MLQCPKCGYYDDLDALQNNPPFGLQAGFSHHPGTPGYYGAAIGATTGIYAQHDPSGMMLCLNQQMKRRWAANILREQSRIEQEYWCSDDYFFAGDKP